ncbi:MAG TPA: transglycosylase domain-containing protein [Candidatus Acidoferrales bacterium]|nr:transglycosylase domain-containing protein [Candidatus Acidoferrales bacterium]
MYWPIHFPRFALPSTSVSSSRGYLSRRPLRWALFGLLAAGALAYELQTSAVQGRLLAYYASRLSYEIVPGASPRIVFPETGPADEIRGYKALPLLSRRAVEMGYRIARQAKQSAALARLIRWGISPPYREPAAVGLTVRDRRGSVLYQAAHPERYFRDFNEIPPLLVQTLLFIENRELNPQAQGNPAIEWDRLLKASAVYALHKLGFSVPLEGGSTLAVQLEKFRHSANGRTNSAADKARQILAASLKAYREGGAAIASWKRSIVVDYFNAMPLAAPSGYGEVYGLGEGLHAWFGMSLKDVTAALNSPEVTPAKVAAYKHALALIASVRAPTRYLLHDRAALEDRTQRFARALARAGVLDARLARALERAPLRFVSSAGQIPAASFAERKAINAVRTDLLGLLAVPGLHDLDRLHLQVETTIDGRLQREISAFLQKLHSAEFVEALGLNRSERLLGGADPTKVNYSFLLYERTAAGNALRVHADSLDQPFDINRGVKLELGSTAKLRTLAHYLELMALLYRELAPLDLPALQRYAGSAEDPLSQWAAETLMRERGADLDTFLQLALERRYSASPYEAFFTGGGIHTFQNFSADENGRILTVREALQRSTNLVFIRLMRDLVRFHQARLPYDAARLLADLDHPLRRSMLEGIAEEESRAVLRRAHKKYRGLAPAELVARFLEKRATSPRHLAMLFFAWNSEREKGDLAAWLERFLGKPLPQTEIDRLWRAYSNPRLDIADYGYLLSRDSLEVWGAGQLFHEPNLSWEDLFARSADARRISSAWLFKTRNRRAQEVRLRTRIERDAFARMTPYWRRLGFPFDRLVPSYATAIGNSSDQPAALADLMGIILNDGARRPALVVHALRFAEGTPYETVLEAAPKPQERILDAAVARALRAALADVVEQGTARSLKGAFRMPVGGKTGSGDNRFETFNRFGNVRTSRVVSRTATFVFYIGDRYFGVISAFVDGPQAGRYRFTSALPVSLLRFLAPVISEQAAPDSKQPALAGEAYAQAR